ncbi:hypothetical protein G3R49_00515 [Shewanella sp. WXL01]|uniref:hypothetical protein n=1 Tax=Shewanella sp. WXL01 TaxID=2709721 RepID=UPI0014386930|nr:hypothetical protein [Shewanella sp. WXL01]NKF49058.1 hypothetical protein [Shewanella sp. WXL01]
MKRLISQLSIAIALTLSPIGLSYAEPFTPLTDEQLDMLIELNISQLKRSNSIKTTAACTGLSEQQLISAFQHTMKTCLSQYGIDEHQMNACMQQEMKKVTGLSDATIAECDDSDSRVQHEQQKQHLLDKIDEMEQRLTQLQRSAPLGDADEEVTQLAHTRNTLDQYQAKLSMLEDQMRYSDLSANEMALEKLYQTLGSNDPTPAQEQQMKHLMDLIAKEQQAEVNELQQVLSVTQ